jgi:hypothetical protein
MFHGNGGRQRTAMDHAWQWTKIQWRSCSTNSGRASSTKAFISTIKLNLSWASPAKITKDCSDPGRATAQVGPNVAPPLPCSTCLQDCCGNCAAQVTASISTPSLFFC